MYSCKSIHVKYSTGLSEMRANWVLLVARQKLSPNKKFSENFEKRSIKISYSVWPCLLEGSIFCWKICLKLVSLRTWLRKGKKKNLFQFPECLPVAYQWYLFSRIMKLIEPFQNSVEREAKGWCLQNHKSGLQWCFLGGHLLYKELSNISWNCGCCLVGSEGLFSQQCLLSSL